MNRLPFYPLAFLFCTLGSLEAEKSEPVRILFIGNSYTSGIKGAFQKLVKASPHADTVVETITPGGKTLEFHLENDATVKRIKEGNWDFVVLQDQSQTPAIFPEKFEKAALGLDKIIDGSGATTVFYLTWGRRDGDKKNAERFPTYDKMQNALTESYRSTAKRAKAKIAPVGDAWGMVRKADQKLGRELFRDDGSHPDAKGAYLAACVFYATLFGEDPATVAFDAGLAPAERKTILKAVDEAGANLSN